jgi:hypothetical protein
MVYYVDSRVPSPIQVERTEAILSQAARWRNEDVGIRTGGSPVLMQPVLPPAGLHPHSSHNSVWKSLGDCVHRVWLLHSKCSANRRALRMHCRASALQYSS